MDATLRLACFSFLLSSTHRFFGRGASLYHVVDGFGKDLKCIRPGEGLR
jgi:hypothetical protein